jgi:hypothetical protein
MGPSFRIPPLSWLIFGASWAAGVVCIWQFTPVVPRQGWQPCEGEFVVGFLNAGPTLVTARHLPSPKGAPLLTGPIHLWDIATGQLRASYLGPHDIYRLVKVEQENAILLLQQAAAGGHRLALHDAWTGKELMSFPGLHQLALGWDLALNGETIAFITYHENLSRIEWRHVPSGRLLHTLPGYEPPICFSPDGRYFAATHGEEIPGNWLLSKITVWDVPTGRRLVTFTHPKPSRPKEFSPDGELLLDDACHIWEVATGKMRFEVPGIDAQSSTFTADGQWLAVTKTKLIGESWLLYYRLSTGAKHPERRRLLKRGNYVNLNLRKAAADGRYLLATGRPDLRQPTRVQRWLARLPLFRGLSETSPRDAFVLLDSKTGREIKRGPEIACGCTPDGRFLLTEIANVDRRRQDSYQLWDTPPRPRADWLWVAISGWTCCMGLVCWRVMRGKASASPCLKCRS